MYQALYRKYRPTSFSDVCGQEEITSVLKAQLQKGRVSHAYMFCGSRGTGKTTCAKILAKAVNCENLQNGEPCNVCDSCRAINEERVLDVVEMDAASNNGVDHIRRLCDEVQFLPSECKKRVYIIDEVHMLSTSAFNALLKTIEEPPAHVMFILATTEMHDIPVTIMSRCVRFDFKRISPHVIADRLLYVSEKENISLEKEAAMVIAKLSDGAMRDALSLLEACRSKEGVISAQSVHNLLGLSPRSRIISLCRAIAEQNAVACLEIVNDIYGKTSNFKEVIGDLVAICRDLLVMKHTSNFFSYVDCYENELEDLQKIANLYSVETLLYHTKELENFYISYDRIAAEKKASSEILFLRLCNEQLNESREALLSRIAKLEKAVSGGAILTKKTLEIKNESLESNAGQSSIKEQSVKVIKEEKKSGENPPERFADSLKLKNRLQEEAFIKPWLPQIEFVKEGSVLYLYCGAFVKGMLNSTKADEIILNCAREIDSEIERIIMAEKKETSPSDESEWGGL